MNTQQLLFAFLILVGLASCASDTGKNSESLTQKTAILLEEGDLFLAEKIQAFLKQNTESNKEANELFLNGLDAYKNKKDLQEAKALFMASLLIQPSAVTYYELGNIHMDLKDYAKALECYQMAEKIGYEPFSKVLYNLACVYSQLDSLELAGNFLEYSIQAGYTNIDNINKDKDLAKLRETWRFSYHLKQGLSGVSDADNLFWLQFKKQFTATSLPLTIGETKKRLQFTDEMRISYDYEKYITEMRDAKFSREVSQGFYYFAQLPDNEKYVTLIYVSKEEFLGDEAPLLYRLVTFSHDGKLIDKLTIAGRNYFNDPLLACSIDKKSKITITSFETTYKKDPEEHGYENNPVVSKKELKKETYIIDKGGKIVSLLQDVTAMN
jgi:tetratricopeptide (TPR) repeat protein